MLPLLQKLIIVSPYFFPAYLFRFQIAGVPFTVPECFTYLLFGLWYVERIRDRGNFVWNPALRRYFYVGLLFLVGASIGVFAAPDFLTLPDRTVVDAQRVALGVWKGWVLAPLLYFIVLAQALRTPRQVETVLRQFIHSAVIVSLIAYGYGVFASGVTYDLRLRGFFESANYLALYIGPALLLAIYYYFHSDAKKATTRLWDTAVITILGYTFLFTQSYAGILSLFGALFLWSVYSFHHRLRDLRRFSAALIAMGLIFMGILITQWHTPKFQNFLNFGERSSTSVRMEIYRVSARLIERDPLTGIGLGLFQPRYQIASREVLNRAPLEWNMPHPHNLFLAHWMNAGLLGLLALLAFIGLMHRSFTYPLVAMWGLLLHGLVDTPFWKNDLAMIFWLLLAAIYLLQSSHADAPAKKRAGKTRR